jgi:hypothetical protein
MSNPTSAVVNARMDVVLGKKGGGETVLTWISDFRAVSGQARQDLGP